MKYTYRRIIDSLPQKKNTNSSLWVKILIRKISFPFTFLFINIGFSANAVSVLSIFVAIAGCVCFCIPSKCTLIAAVMLINMWLVLDCVDGNIARCNKAQAVFGEFVDDIGGYYTEAFAYVAIGVQVYLNGGVLIQEGTIGAIVLAAVSSIANVLSRLIYKDYCHFADCADQTMQEQHTVDNKKSLYYIRNRVSKEFGISGLFMPFTILSAFINGFDLMTLFYFAFNLFALLSTTFIYIWKADRYDRHRGQISNMNEDVEKKT